MYENDCLHENKQHRRTFSEQTLYGAQVKFFKMNSVCHVYGINIYVCFTYTLCDKTVIKHETKQQETA